MSLVRISKDLLHSVENHIARSGTMVCEKTIDPLKPTMSAAVKSTLVDYAINHVWGEFKDLCSKMPREWMQMDARADFHLMKDEVNIGGEFRIEDKRFSLPCTKNGNNGYVDIKLPIEEAPAEFTVPLLAWHDASIAHAKKYRTVKVQVLAFLKSSASLNDALKRYPDLALYIPDGYIERVNEKVERQARDKTERPDAASIDRDFLTSTGVVGKLHE